MGFNIYRHESEELFSQSFVAKTKFKSPVPEDIGKGQMEGAPLCEKIFYTKQKLVLNKNIIIQSSTADDDCQIEYFFLFLTLQGNNQIEMLKSNRTANFSKGHAYLGFTSIGESLRLQTKDKNIQQHSFTFSRQTLIEYLIELDQPELIKQVENTNHFNVYRSIRLRPAHDFIIQKMFNSPYTGSLQKIHFQSCAIDLFLALLSDLTSKRILKSTFNKNDERLLNQAKDILLLNIQTPPSIDELAKKVGMNKEKLTEGFKAQFGNTVFKTLTQERMKLAYEQLKNDQSSIAQIAFNIGYSNVSSFIQTFQKEFGRTPGKIRKEIRYYS